MGRDLARVPAIGLLLFALAGCAGARVSDVASSVPVGHSPSEILVAVDAAPMPDSSQSAAAQNVASALQSALVRQLIRAHVTAEPFEPGTTHPDCAILHVSITTADPGSRLERLVVGFGVGKAKLQAHTTLQTNTVAGAMPMTMFDTASDSGVKPGLILPGGVALATGNAIHLAIGGGIDIATNLRGGLSRPTSSTASAIVAQLRKYYAGAGWTWPADSET